MWHTISFQNTCDKITLRYECSIFFIQLVLLIFMIRRHISREANTTYKYTKCDIQCGKQTCLILHITMNVLTVQLKVEAWMNVISSSIQRNYTYTRRKIAIHLRYQCVNVYWEASPSSV